MAKLLGFEIFDGSKSEYIDKIMESYNKDEKTVLLSGNPEVLYSAVNNSIMKSLCLQSDIIPDGVGVIIAGKITGQRFKEKIAGIEVLQEFMKISGQNDMKIYMLGAENWVVEKAASVCKEKYGSKIAGYHDGYFDINDCGDILDHINKSNADILLVAMGCPRQESFILKYKDMLKCSIYMAVGGSFDVLAGKVSRAPKWMINAGLEWLYRVAKEPKRIKRLTSIPKFLLKVIINKQ